MGLVKVVNISIPKESLIACVDKKVSENLLPGVATVAAKIKFRLVNGYSTTSQRLVSDYHRLYSKVV